MLVKVSDRLGTLAILADSEGGRGVKICEQAASPQQQTQPASVATFRRPATVKLDPYNFAVQYINLCVKPSDDGCPGQVWSGWGFAPDRAARVTFETVDGTTTAASLRDGVWVWRRIEPAVAFHDLPPLIVRVYDSADRLLLEHDVNEQPDIPAECEAMSGGC